jgi:hypothetical protein
VNDWPAGLTLRPIQAWPGTMTADRDRRRSNFSAPWRSTLDTLDRELWHLNAHTRVLQVAMREQDFRIDGMPRANAKAEHPGIILSFHAPDVGDLSYPCDTFTTWQDNLRAIALALEALRKVDRYGVTRRGEQYRGWKAIEDKATALPAAMTVDQALAVLARFSGATVAELEDRDELRAARRIAQRKTHPDVGGSAGDFQQVQRAIDALRQAGRLP